MKEGGTYSKFVDLIRTTGANHDVLVRFGRVTSGSPSLRIDVDGVDRVLDAEDVLIGASVATLQSGDRVIMLGYETEYGREYVVLDKIT
ncbi:hypothetical protein [Alkalicoccus chagannorensis]|uniref:hypothetical protein n=1 Tax=Alkalicoccus chagannorensis TaxID=427072 RepID=UPI00040C3252|nr:hypothetical protein [Alkalicoccus chagannorensis]